MKNSITVIKAVTIILTASCFMACKKTLKEYNPSGTTAQTVYTTAPGFETLIAGSYSFTKFWYGKEEGFGLGEMGTDLWTLGSEGWGATSGLTGDNRSLVLYQFLNGVNGNLTREWKKLYAGVNLCNQGIKIAADGDFTPTPSQLGELHFLRAFYYWHIVEQWGGVHFSTEPTLEAVTTANKTPVETFYALMESDLLFAVANLPNAPSSVYGRVNKQGAQAFLARVYLTMGYKNPAYFIEAKKMADAVIASGKYKLATRYADLWDMSKQTSNGAGNGAGEVIWSVNYSSPTVVSDVYNEQTNPFGYGEDILSANGNPTNNRGNNNAHTLFVPRYEQSWPFFPIGATPSNSILNRDVRNGTSFTRFKPTKFLLGLYDGSKDERYKGSFQTVWYLNKTVSGGPLAGKRVYKDTAFAVDKGLTPKTNYYAIDANTLYNANGSSIGTNSPTNAIFPALLKFLDSTRSASPNDLGAGNIQGAKDVYVLRLAEMYLISAEASVMMNESTDALDKVNFLRRERAITGRENDMVVTADSMNLDFILNERAREFAGETIRWFDLKRTGKLLERVKKYNADLALYIQPFHILRPIPQQQLDALTNKSEFAQNPGY